MTHNLCTDAVTNMQHATGALRRLTVLVSMGAVPSREDYALVHRQAVELNQVFNRLLKALKAQGMFEDDSGGEAVAQSVHGMHSPDA